MLDAAVEVISERGFHAASMDEIAERAGISKPLLYLYLGSKEQTFSACIAREADRLVDTIGAAADGSTTDPADRLWRGLTAFFTFVAANRSSWIVLYQQARSHSDDVAEQLARVRQVIIGTVTDLVLDAVMTRATATAAAGHGGYAAQRRESAATAHTIVGAADAMAEWALTIPDEPPQATARRLMDIIWIGLERHAAGEHFKIPEP